MASGKKEFALTDEITVSYLQDAEHSYLAKKIKRLSKMMDHELEMPHCIYLAYHLKGSTEN